MMKGIRKGFLLPLCLSVVLLFGGVASAHHGGGHHGGGHHSSYYSYSYTPSYSRPHCYYHSDCYYHSNGCPTRTCYYRAGTVKKVQKRLSNLGYSCGRTDGVYGTSTKKAVKKFQKKKHMTVNGVINKKLLTKLKIS